MKVDPDGSVRLNRIPIERFGEYDRVRANDDARAGNYLFAQLPGGEWAFLVDFGGPPEPPGRFLQGPFVVRPSPIPEPYYSRIRDRVLQLIGDGDMWYQQPPAEREAWRALRRSRLYRIARRAMDDARREMQEQGAFTALQRWVSLHTAEPTEDQAHHEASFEGYRRVFVNNTAEPIFFPECTGGDQTITHIGIGSSFVGAGVLLARVPLQFSIRVSSGLTVRLSLQGD